MKTEELISAIKGKDEAARARAWMNAGASGVDAVGPLAALMSDDEREIQRAATRALWKMVRHSGRPGAGAEAKTLAQALQRLVVESTPVAVCRELCWMLSEIAGDDAVPVLARLLAHKELHEDARAALQRIPGQASLAALQEGLTKGPEEYRPAVADSLRKRGVAVSGVENAKLKPVKQTQVKPVGR